MNLCKKEYNDMKKSLCIYKKIEIFTCGARFDILQQKECKFYEPKSVSSIKALQNIIISRCKYLDNGYCTNTQANTFL